jgi:hypothetical protein
MSFSPNKGGEFVGRDANSRILPECAIVRETKDNIHEAPPPPAPVKMLLGPTLGHVR